MTLGNSLLKLLLVTLAAPVLVWSRGEGRSVSLLFENDGIFTGFGNKPSALLFHERLPASGAFDVCKQNNETLLASEEVDAIKDQLAYFAFIGDIQRDTKFWASKSRHTSSKIIAVSPLSDVYDSAVVDSNKKLAFLCTNSAPHTTKVDTDFSMSPKTNVSVRGATFIGTRDHLTFRFMGIPYAQPPTDDLRFRYPVKLNTSRDIVEATSFQPACIQSGDFTTPVFNPQGVDEDCLYLNIYTPFIPSDPSSHVIALKPVVFWIHGGTNVHGTGSDRTFDGGPLVSRGDVVVVTINYRLGMFGFLALNDGVVTGNYGLADKIAALEWVRDNIASFGGDPNRVTIMGHSAGGWSIVDLLRSPKAAGLFHAAVSQSGGASTFLTQEQAGLEFAPLVAAFCNGTGEERLQCLQTLPVETLLNITDQTFWESVQDGVFVVNQTVAQVGQGPGAVNSVPFMTGFMPDESQSLLGDAISPNATDFNATLFAAGEPPATVQAVLESGLWVISDEFTVYNATVNVDSGRILTCPAVNMITAAAESKAFPALFIYIMQRAYGEFEFDPFNLCTFPVGEPQPYYRCHAGDLYEVFGTYYLFNEPARETNDFAYNSLVQDLWTSFARTHNPNPSLELLKVRGRAYASTLELLKQTGWIWPEFEKDNQVLASLEYPQLGLQDGLPDDRNGRCEVLCEAGCLF